MWTDERTHGIVPRMTLANAATLSAAEVARRAQSAELDALARASRPVSEGAAGVANIEAARRQREVRALDRTTREALAGTQRAAVEYRLEHAHEEPIPADAPAHIRAALERIKAMTADERAAELARIGITPAPERVRGRFTLTDAHEAARDPKGAA